VRAFPRSHQVSTSLLVASDLPILTSMQMTKQDQQPSLWRQALRTSVLRSLAAEEIAARAYAKYLGREASDERAVNDWLEAERELLQEKIVPRE
jgi:Protein of unknown function (DUF2934)